MRQTLFYIPESIGGVPLFGAGILLVVWSVVGLALLIATVRKQGWTRDTLIYGAFLGVVALAVWKVVPSIGEPGRGLPVRGYGMMLLAGTLAGVGLALFRARQVGLNTEFIYGLASWMFVAGLVGARVFYVVEYWNEYERATWRETLFDMLNIAQGGLVVYGSAIGAALAFVVYVKKHKLPLLATADLIVPSLFVGLSLGRIGCFLNGCCFGGVCELPWAVEFPWNSPPHQRQVQQGQLYLHGLKITDDVAGRPRIEAVETGSQAEQAGLAKDAYVVEVQGVQVGSAAHAERLLLDTYGAGERVAVVTSDSPQAHVWTLASSPGRSLPTHPTQLYSAFDAALIALFLLVYEPFRRRPGELTALAFIIYPITRFLIEIIRTDESAVFGTGMSISQNISLAVLAGAVAMLVWLRTQPARI